MELINAITLRPLYRQLYRVLKYLAPRIQGIKTKENIPTCTGKCTSTYIHTPDLIILFVDDFTQVKISCLDRDGWDKYGDTEFSKIKRAISMKIETSFQKIRQDHGRNMLPNNEQH